jgi:carbon storage regulator
MTLVLSRRENESVRIGEVIVTIQQLRKNAVKLAIDAPKHIKILRTELPDQQPEKMEKVDATSNTG